MILHFLTAFFDHFLSITVFHQAPVVKKVDNSIQWINRYPADKMYFNQYILSFDASFSSLISIGREQTTWPANNCLQIMVLNFIIQQIAPNTFNKCKKSSKVKTPIRTCTLIYDYKLQKMKLICESYGPERRVIQATIFSR